MTDQVRLEHMIREVFNNDTVTLEDDTVLQEIPGWDSLRQINLMFAIEEETGTCFAGTEIFELRTVSDLKAYLAGSEGGRSPARPKSSRR